MAWYFPCVPEPSMSAVSVVPVVAVSTSNGVPRYCNVLSIAAKAASVPLAVMRRMRASTEALAIGAAYVGGAAYAPGAATRGTTGIRGACGAWVIRSWATNGAATCPPLHPNPIPIAAVAAHIAHVRSRDFFMTVFLPAPPRPFRRAGTEQNVCHANP